MQTREPPAVPYFNPFAKRDSPAPASPPDDTVNQVISGLTRARTDAERYRKAVALQIEDFLNKEGADLFERDASGKLLRSEDGSPVPKMETQIEELRRKAAARTGLISGALSPTRSRGDPTPEAIEAQRQLKQIEPVYRLKMERYQRMQEELRRAEQLERDATIQIGELAKTRIPGFEVTGEDVLAAVRAVNRKRNGMRVSLDDMAPPPQQSRATPSARERLRTPSPDLLRRLDENRTGGPKYPVGQPVAQPAAQSEQYHSVEQVALEPQRRLGARIGALSAARLAGKAPADENQAKRMQKEQAVLMEVAAKKAKALKDIPLRTKVASALGSLVQGLAELPAGVSDWIAITAKKIDDAAPEFMRAYKDKELENLATARFAKWIRDTVREIAPTDPQLAEDFWFNKVPQAVGSMLSFIGAGAITKSPVITPVVLGGAVGGAAGYADAKSKGADDETAFRSMLLNTAVGTTEAVPISRMLARLNKLSGGRFGQVLVDAGIEGAEEWIQEFAQTTAGNAIAQQLYDEHRDLFDDALMSGNAGGVSGVLASLLISAVAGRHGQNNTQPPTQKGPDDARQTQVQGQGQGQGPVAPPPQPATADQSPQKPQESGAIYAVGSAESPDPQAFLFFDKNGGEPQRIVAPSVRLAREQLPEGFQIDRVVADEPSEAERHEYFRRQQETGAQVAAEP
ncbi:MAG: hypothetical protein D6692_01720, partial [Planctomycetota bacterium]